jgi:YVTN family beta-propeller protein
VKKVSYFFVVAISFFASCKQDKADPDTHGYPVEVGQIIITKCATSGCHNDASHSTAGGLNLSSWDKLFAGSNGTSSVIPYRTDFSTLCFYINTFPDLGPALVPTMPYNSAPLSRKEVETIYNWVTSGAPDANGFVKFSDDPNRKKIYVANQGCRVVTVFDQETLLPMRYIDVEGGNVSTHNLKVSPDQQHWYTISLGGTKIKKFRTSDDSYVGEVTIPVGNYNTFVITADSKKAYVVDFSASGVIVEADLENLQLLNTYTTTDWSNIHGSALSPDGQYLYVTSQQQNRIFKIPLSDFSSYEEIILNPSFSGTQGVTKPHEVIFSPDGTKYFVSCIESNDVYVFNSVNDSLLTVIPVGTFPVEFAFSTSQPYLFVSCMEDVTNLTAPVTGKKGVISVINYNTNSFVQHIDGNFYQPHGIAVDEDKGMLYVASRNTESNGPAPHHTTACGGRNGFVTFVSLSNFQVVGKRVEVSVDPYAIGLRQ